MGLRVTLLVHDLSDGAMARAEAMHHALVALGHTPRTLGVRGNGVWLPLAASPWAATARRVPRADLPAAVADGTDLLLTVKPFEASLGLGLTLSRRLDLPLLADVDDPDVEVLTTWLPRREALRQVGTRPRAVLQLLALRRAARRLPTTVSNPVLQRLYGGEVVPHARPDRGPGAPHTSVEPVLAFIGTARAHKGVDLLRAAARRLAPEGWRLLVTDYTPTDPAPWETWTGAEVPDTWGLLCRSDVVAIPSHDVGRGRAQLPLKLVDAMQAGRAVVTSDAGPLPWAAGPGASVFRSGDAASLVQALRPLRDPVVRARAGSRAREEALARYSPEVVAEPLERAIDSALARGRWRQRVAQATAEVERPTLADG